MEIVITVGLILLSLSLLIVIHEFGHFWAARMFKIRVEKFFLFFDWKFKLFSVKKGDTEWGIGWLPLGGYVKISGMMDESMDKEQMALPPQPYEFRAKPTWQRLIVMLGGVIMNAILGILIFIALKWMVGDMEISHAGDHNGLWKATDGIWVSDSSLAYHMGFRTGDHVHSFEGDTMHSFTAISDPSLLINDGAKFGIKRNGKDSSITISEGMMDRFMEKKEMSLFVPDMKPVVLVMDTAMVTAYKVAEKDTADMTIQGWRGGLRDRDLITMIDSTPVGKFSEVTQYLKGKGGQTIQVTVDRQGKSVGPLPIALKADGRLGILPHLDTLRARVRYSFGEAIPAGTATAFKVVSDNVKGLTAMVSGKINAGKSLSGPVGIAKIMKRGFDAGGWENFWRLTAMLSMVLAVMNLLPIPVLDGGQILILIVEAIIGRELPIKLKEIVLTIGFVMVIALMLFAVFNDIFR